MLRVVLVGLLSAVTLSCKSGEDAPKAQPGVAAGKVVEVSGTVTVRHGGTAQPLAKGATVEADDVIETGADGNAIIELSHNLARWELGPNKQQKLRESTAWGLAKKSGDVAVVQQDTAAAGRPAERSAADTSVSAQTEAAPAPAAMAPAAAVAPAAQPPTPGGAPPAATAAAPPPPPAPAPEPKRAREVAPKATLDQASGGGGAPEKSTTRGLGAIGSVGKGGGASASAGDGDASGGGATGGGATMTPAEADKAATDLVLKNDKQLKACLTKDAPSVSVTIKVAANGKATAIVSADKPVPGSVQSCVKAAVAKMKFAAAATTVKVELSK